MSASGSVHRRVVDRSTATTVSPWAVLTLASGWSNNGGGYSTARQQIDSAGRVHLDGLVKTASAVGYGAVITTLPAGRRPLTAVGPYTVATATGTAKLDVLSTGAVRVLSSIGAGEYVALAQISFPTN